MALKSFGPLLDSHAKEESEEKSDGGISLEDDDPLQSSFYNAPNSSRPPIRSYATND